MAKTSSLNLQATVTGDGASLTYTPPGAPFTNAVAPMGGPIPTAMASGANTITVPVGSTAVVIVPPIASVVVKTLKGIAGDTGVIISPTLPTMIGLATGTSNFVLNCSAIETIALMWL